MNKLNLIMGAQNGAKTKREENDFYATHPDTVVSFLKESSLDNVIFSNDIWECACGKGHISETLLKLGYNVYSTDLINRGYGIVQDFLMCDKPFNGDIITNPPYKYATEFVYKRLNLLQDDKYLCLFLKLQFLEGEKRKKLFKEFPPKYIYIHSKRQKIARNGDFEKYGKNSNSLAFCWIVWQKGYKGDSIIRWI